MALKDVPRTVVEFRDYAGAESAPAHKSARVFVNGTEVLVEKDGADITFGAFEATVVTLRILPTEVRFTH